MESWKLGTKITIFYNDLPNSVSKVIGTLIEETENFVVVETDKGKVKIPFLKIIRIEEGLKE